MKPLLLILQFLRVGQQLLDELCLPRHGEPIGHLEVHPEQLQVANTGMRTTTEDRLSEFVPMRDHATYHNNDISLTLTSSSLSLGSHSAQNKFKTLVAPDT